MRSVLPAYHTALRAHLAAARVFLVEIVGVNDAIDGAFARSLVALLGPFWRHV